MGWFLRESLTFLRGCPVVCEEEVSDDEGVLVRTPPTRRSRSTTMLTHTMMAQMMGTDCIVPIKAMLA